MKVSIFDKLVQSLKQAAQHNSDIMVKPEVILWPDPERQWKPVIPLIQKANPAMMIFGPYQPDTKQGPAIWIKCMVAGLMPHESRPKGAIPIVYLPGISKNDLKNIHNVGLDLQPLIEYQYTGTMFTQTNGREWTVMAFLQNREEGMGLNIAQDLATKSSILKALPVFFESNEISYPDNILDADFFNNLMFPDIIPNILKWICKGDKHISTWSKEKQEVFKNICKNQYDIELDYRLIIDITEKLGSQKQAWKQVWQYYANAPSKFPEIENLLRLSKPEDLGSGIFALPEESWPQVNEQKEDELREELSKLSKSDLSKVLNRIKELEQTHSSRRQWVWSELDKAPLAESLKFLNLLVGQSRESYSSSSIDDLRKYYSEEGFRIDTSMRKAFASVKTDKDKEVVRNVFNVIYKPWLEKLTGKFQELINKDHRIFTEQVVSEETESYILFVDALRWEMAAELSGLLSDQGFKTELNCTWSAIPSLTSTSKPANSPIANQVSLESNFNDFRPETNSGKDLQTAVFRETLLKQGWRLVTKPSDIVLGKNHWQEIGDIDTKGHAEQGDLVKRIDELFESIKEALDTAFEKGINRIKIITDHGWLLLPGGLPKATLSKDLIESRTGRCALIKEGAETNLLHLPWKWNPSIFIAYAPGISFFKKNEEYAHGGLSLQECLIPEMIVERTESQIPSAMIRNVKWINLRCTIETENAPDGYKIDIRTKYSDSGTSILLSKNLDIQKEKCVVMADDSFESESAVIILTDEKDRIIDKKPTVVGES
ncbi:MAG: BREX-1 system phosphatase PglZ type B [Bacteroidales bacterium]